LLAAGVLALLCSLPLFQAWRLHVLIASYTQSVWLSTRIFFIGAFFNNVLPSNVGGDAVRLVYLRGLRGGSWAEPLALLLLHRLSGIAVIVLVALLYAPFDAERIAATLSVLVPRSVEMTLMVLAFVGVPLVGLATALLLPSGLRNALWKKSRELLTRCSHALAEVSAAGHLALVVLTLGYHAARMLGFYLIVAFMGGQVGFGDLIIVMAVTAVVALVPVTVGALGVMEGSITVLLGLYGVSPTAALAVALLNRFVLLLNAAVGGVLYLVGRSESPAPQSREP
jgi:uncharacterized protein (TIRG00374 family)